MTDELPGIGHNNPPLAEVLADETKTMRDRADALVASAGRCAVTDQETAEKATTLARMIKDHGKEVDNARVARKQPYLDAERTIDATFKAIIAPLDTAGKKVVGQIDAYRREQERLAAEERRRQEEEARRLREQAEAAERARRQAELKAQQEAAEGAALHCGGGNAARHEAALQAELEVRRLQDAADAAARAAATVQTEVITSEYGVKASGRKVKVYAVTDAQKLGLWLLRNNPDALTEALLKLAEPIAKGMKLPPGSTAIPGLEITETTTTVIR